jgi:hypothetical protein
MTGTRSRVVARQLPALIGVALVTALVAACSGPATGGGAPAAAPVPTASSAAPGPTGPAAAPVNPNAPEPNSAGDIPDNQVFVPYMPAGAAFRVSVPEGWARTTGGAATVFTDKFNSVRIEVLARPTAPTANSARTDEVPTLAGQPGFAPGGVTETTRAAGRVVLVTYTATSPADPVTGKSVPNAVERYEYWKDGQEVVLTLAGPRGADNVDPWRTVTDSFRWLP